MNPLPLTNPTGRVLAYACGRCLHVGASGERMVVRPADVGEIAVDHANGSRLVAERCCLCTDCDAVLTQGDGGYLRMGRCPPCDKVQRARLRLFLAHTLTRPRIRRALAALARLREVRP